MRYSIFATAFVPLVLGMPAPQMQSDIMSGSEIGGAPTGVSAGGFSPDHTKFPSASGGVDDGSDGGSRPTGMPSFGGADGASGMPSMTGSWAAQETGVAGGRKWHHGHHGHGKGESGSEESGKEHSGSSSGESGSDGSGSMSAGGFGGAGASASGGFAGGDASPTASFGGPAMGQVTTQAAGVFPSAGVAQASGAAIMRRYY